MACRSDDCHNHVPRPSDLGSLNRFVGGGGGGGGGGRGSRHDLQSFRRTLGCSLGLMVMYAERERERDGLRNLAQVELACGTRGIAPPPLRRLSAARTAFGQSARGSDLVCTDMIDATGIDKRFWRFWSRACSSTVCYYDRRSEARYSILWINCSWQDSAPAREERVDRASR